MFVTTRQVNSTYMWGLGISLGISHLSLFHVDVFYLYQNLLVVMCFTIIGLMLILDNICHKMLINPWGKANQQTFLIWTWMCAWTCLKWHVFGFIITLVRNCSNITMQSHAFLDTICSLDLCMDSCFVICFSININIVHISPFLHDLWIRSFYELDEEIKGMHKFTTTYIEECWNTWYRC